MVGKYSSLSILRKILIKEGIPVNQIVTSRLSQGSTHRWIIAWTYSPLLSFLYFYNLKFKMKDLFSYSPQFSSEFNKINYPTFNHSVLIKDLISTSLADELEEAKESSTFINTFFNDALYYSNFSTLDLNSIKFYLTLFYNRILNILTEYNNFNKNNPQLNSSLKNLVLDLDYSIVQEEIIHIDSDKNFPFFTLNFPSIQVTIKFFNLLSNTYESLFDFSIEIKLEEEMKSMDSMANDLDNINSPFKINLIFKVIESNTSESILK